MFRKASNIFSGKGKTNKNGAHYEDNEVLFCKNNVCVHPHMSFRRESDMIHHPGYLTVTTKTFVDQFNKASRSTLLLSWIPNSSLCKSRSDEGMFRDNVMKDLSREIGSYVHNFVEPSETGQCNASKHEIDSLHVDIQELRTELQPLLSDQINSIHDLNALLDRTPITSVDITISNPYIENINVKPSICAVVTDIKNTYLNHHLPEGHIICYPTSDPSLPIYRQSSDEITQIAQWKNTKNFNRFTVDLSQMRSLRLFFNDDTCTSGQLVIASRESQYKILHFHYGGLDHLAQVQFNFKVLHQWHCFLHNIAFTPTLKQQNSPYRQFMVCRPEIKQTDLHPEEGNGQKITTNFFYGTLLNIKGQIEDGFFLRKCVFFGGLEKSLRRTIWPFLLKCYSFSSTFDDRAVLMDIRKQEYDEITRKRLYSMSPEEQIHFWKSVQCVVEKDIARIDRKNTFFCGDHNPNKEAMKSILLNYAFYNAGKTYSQGVSELLSPVFNEIQNESETFWSFVGVLQHSFFICAHKDVGIDGNLNYLRELIRIMLPTFYEHLKLHDSSMELLFCHRWLILCFKREFTESVVIRMWEACWSNYLTDYFHLFLCLAIIAVYTDDVVAQNLRADEMLFYFSSLAMYMDGQIILRKARGLLYKYRQLSKIPCTLIGLCKRCGPGMWDSDHCPALECVGHSEDDKCPLDID
ncbi:TBC1 domain family member 16 isoform X4 [Eurosta solidaginis]|uniref:TBC1 domain family member 16 isoform X4 n=1 Tax=Eurosta solidaginis TaxID=178769 RepID=UPI003530BDC3